MRRFQYGFVLFVVLALSVINISPISAQTSDRPMILPVQGEPGPDTWLFGQPYGNTVGAYNFGSAWYSAGQGLHFGLDFPMPCGTPLVAVADGQVAGVDNLSRGAGPHNLLLSHPDLNVTTLYGHLLEPSTLIPGQTVTQGQIVGFSGDPDSTCDSRPHLHFEVRSMDYFVAYNPVDFIDANWHMLASIGGYSYPLFQQDMNNSRQWMTLESQPNVAFGGRRLNSYATAWPLPYNLRAPENPPLNHPVTPIAEDATWSLRTIGYDNCCWEHWWDAVDPDRLYVVDGSPNQLAAIFAWSATSGSMTEVLYPAPPLVTSPDGTYGIYNNGGTSTIRNLADTAEEYIVQTQGATPAISTDNSKLTWTVRSSIAVPGQSRPNHTIWVSALDGTTAREVLTEPGISAEWMDANRLLIIRPQESRFTTISVYNAQSGVFYDLGTFYNMRGLNIAPGGGSLMFYVTWQTEGTGLESGVYTLDVGEGATPQRMPWFGGWRWRDSESVYYLPYEPESPFHTLAYYHIPTGENRVLAGPQAPNELYFTIMNGDWDVSADGRRIVFHNATDQNMWLLEVP